MNQPEIKSLTCALVNHGLAISLDGSVLSPCCQYKAHYESPISWQEFDRYQQEFKPRLSQRLAEGIQVKECSHCWDEENINYRSLRLLSNFNYPDVKYRKFNSTDTLDIELRLGNHCNLACIMCSSRASSSWYTELTTKKDIFKDVRAIALHPLVQPVKPYWEDPGFLEFLRPHLITAQRINVSGGEPLTLPMTLDFLELLIELSRTDVVLQFTTNFTRISDRMIEKLKLFKNLDLIISLEGIGPMNEYLRYPSKWTEIEDNIRRFNARGNMPLTRIHHVLQHTSAYALPPLIEWCQQNSMHLTLTYVQGQQQLTPQSIPPEDLANFVNWAAQLTWEKNNSVLTRWITPVRDVVLNLENTQFDEELFVEFRQYISALDQSRGTNYDNVFCPSRV
jgi:sulfatase maturation enzyme AslB (radical SAM superfamily)